MIPQEKSAAVGRGLDRAFGVTAMDEVRKLPQGLGSDLVFRIVVRGAAYLLRIMPRVDERMDPGRIFACMNAAAEAGLAPRVRYANLADGISIIDCVDAVPLAAAQAGVELPALLRKLHGLPPFPETFNYVTAHNGFIWRLRRAELLPKDQVEDVFTRYECLGEVYPRLDADMVSCHMDLKPENLLFDGRRMWLTNWSAAFVNDRYFDLAVAANFLVADAADEARYLEQYFGQPPDEYQRARFFLMRQVVHMLSAAVFLLVASAGKPVGRLECLPSFTNFHGLL